MSSTMGPWNCQEERDYMFAQLLKAASWTVRPLPSLSLNVKREGVANKCKIWKEIEWWSHILRCVNSWNCIKHLLSKTVVYIQYLPSGHFKYFKPANNPLRWTVSWSQIQPCFEEVNEADERLRKLPSVLSFVLLAQPCTWSYWGPLWSDRRADGVR